MKTTVMALIAFAAVLSYAADGNPSAVDDKKPTPEEVKAKMASAMEKMGGLVEVRGDGKQIAIYNAQSRVPSGVVEKVVSQMRTLTSFPFYLENSDAFEGCFGEKAKSVIGEKTAAVVFVVDRKCAETILVAPEQQWAVVNVAPLSEGVDADVAADRVSKEVWRASVFLLGGGVSKFQPSLMQNVGSLAELDGIKAGTPSPETFTIMGMAARKYGVRAAKRGLYRQACKEGWAPAPTNDIQRVIWEQVKAEANTKPSNPIKIKYDPKQGK